MTTQTVTLRIVGENGELVATVRASKAELAGLGKGAADAGAQASRGARGVDELGAASERTRKRATLLGGTLGQLKGLIGGVVAVQTLRDLGRTADAYADISGKLKQVTGSERELAAARQATFEISQKYFTQWDATAQLYTRAAMTSDVLRKDQEKLGEVIETVSASLLLNRASTAEAASAMLQLSQSIGSGVLRGEEFRAVYEAAPQLMQLLADSMGEPVGALKDLAEEGELTIDRMIDAFTGTKARELRDRAQDVPLTIGRAWQRARNDVLKSIGEIDQAIGASGTVAAGVQSLGSILGALAKVGAAVALVFAGRLAGALATSTVAFVHNTQASTAAYLATMRLNTGMGTMPALLARVGTGVRGLGAGLLAFAGGPVGVAVIAIGALIAKFVSARAEARQLRQEVAQAIAESEQFLDTNDLNLALSSGKNLLAQRQQVEDLLKARQATVARLSVVGPGAVAAYDSATGILEDIRKGQADLDEINRRLELNAQRIKDVTAAQAAHAGAAAQAGAENAKFNEQLADQNEKLRVERIEREQGLRAALEYQAMQAAGVKTVGELSQATRDLIDTQVRETTAADAWKEAQKAATDAARDAAKATEEQRKAQAAYADQLELARAELAGPLAVAQAEHDQAIRKLDADYAAHNITLRDYIGLKDVEDEKLRRTTEQLQRQSDILGQVRADYEQQQHLAGLSEEQYRVETELVRRLNDARDAGVPITNKLTDALRRAIETGERQASIAEAARRYAQDFANSWHNAVDSVGRAIGDFATGTIDSFKDLWRTLLDIGKRWASDMISQVFSRAFNGGFAQAGSTSGGGIVNAIAQWIGGGNNSGGSALGGLWNGIKSFLGFGNATATGASYANAYGAAPGVLAAGSGVLMPQYGGGTLAGSGSSTGMLSQLAAVFGKEGSFTKFLNMKYTPWLAAAGGALYGWNSTDDGLGKPLAAGAYGAAAYGATAGLGAGLAAGSLSAGLAAVPVVGWIALAAIAIDKISGGKLFGTKFKVDSATSTFSYGDQGITGSTDITKVRQQSLFRGRKWTHETQRLSDEAQAALDNAFQAITDAVQQAATRLGLEVPTLLSASFKQEFDKNGKLVREAGTIAGRTYRESLDQFNQRYLAENLLAVAGMAGHGQEIDTLANQYRDTPEHLTELATLILAMQEDIKNSAAMWDDVDGAITRVVGVIEDLQQGGEQLAETYARVSAAAKQYGGVIANVRAELLTHDLSDYAKAQLQIELEYRDQVKQANELAKALGLSGARAEDLAAIEQLRAQRMADLQREMERQRDEFLGGLRISDLAPGTDQDKLTDAMGQLQAAVAGGDLQRAQQLAQQVLGYGRNLYASGSDYNALYNTVYGLLEDLDPASMGLTDEALQQIADTLDTLPNDIAAALFDLLASQATTPPPPGSTPPPGGSSGGTNGGSSNGGGTTDPTQAAIAANTAAAAAGIEELLRAQKSRDLREANA